MDATRGQLIEAMARAAGPHLGISPWKERAAAEAALDALLALRDSDGIPLVLGLVAERVDPDSHDPDIWWVNTASHGRIGVPRLSEDKP